MRNYSTHWAITILAAIVLHVAAAGIFSFALPYLAPAPKIQEAASLEWVDVALDDVVVVAEEAIPSAAQEPEPTFNAQDLFVPELKIPEVIIEPLKPPEVEIPKPKPPPQTAKPPQDTKPPPESPKPAAQPEPSNDSRVMSTPPVVVKEIYPEKGSGLGYMGYISIAAHIGKDGKVKSTEIIQTSGRQFVDEIALKAAEQWTFRPALDKFGRPMECDTIITFNFRKLNEQRDVASNGRD